MEMTGAEAILACLKAEQVPVVFGYPGGAVLGLYDAIYKTHFPHILTGHEQGASIITSPYSPCSLLPLNLSETKSGTCGIRNEFWKI